MRVVMIKKTIKFSHARNRTDHIKTIFYQNSLQTFAYNFDLGEKSNLAIVVHIKTPDKVPDPNMRPMGRALRPAPI